MRDCALIVGCVLLFIPRVGSSAVGAIELHVASGQSIQKTIDAAPDGAIIDVAAGVFDERLHITKAVTIRGSSWDKTVIKPKEKVSAHDDAERVAFARLLEKTTDAREQMTIVSEYLDGSKAPAIKIESSPGVVLAHLTVQGVASSANSGPGSEALIIASDARVRIANCAILGPAENGVAIERGSDVEIRQCLVAAVWGTGVAVGDDGRAAKVHLAGCDIRNCYYAGVTISAEGSVIEDCRISGAAWHGIRYDDCSPTITGNLIFGNARSGIYASGTTRATVRNNVFWKNEMEGVSCWSNNGDVISGNTFVDNLREGILVAGDAMPNLTHNIIVSSPIGIEGSQISGKGGNPRPKIEANVFFKNQSDVKMLGKVQPLAVGNIEANPQFVDEEKHVYSLTADSPAGGAGAKVMPDAESPWPLQPAETAIVPTGETRDSKAWNKPPGMR